ncbi:MAG: hypothetical protein JXB48_15710 [Candidatus Latescibacteria bacterium]|nr:hypothetical protein [Candidatus Latescibacterota bacterium]
MGISSADEWYEILDELNSRLEALFEECNESQMCEIMLPALRRKVEDFIGDLEHERETYELIETGR